MAHQLFESNRQIQLELSADVQDRFSTPALMVDLEIFEQNLAAAERMIAGTGKFLRPHVKTHRTPGLALRQLISSAGITCATVGEAEVMLEAGISDLLLANEIVTPQKIHRFASLAKRASVMLAVDDMEPMLALSTAASRLGVTVEVLVDLEVGLGRCGLSDIPSAVKLARAIGKAPGLNFAGIMGYGGRRRAADPRRAERVGHATEIMAEAKAAIESAGLPVRTVSGGGTSTLPEDLKDPTLTEIQAGTYALMEPDLEGLDLPFRCAVHILGTVISRTAGRAVLDVGWKAVGCEYGKPTPLDPRAKTIAIGDEHATMEWNGELPHLGELIALRPSQNRTTFNLHKWVWLVRGRRIEEGLRVAAQGASQ